jgi:hypothetical protein
MQSHKSCHFLACSSSKFIWKLHLKLNYFSFIRICSWKGARLIGIMTRHRLGRSRNPSSITGRGKSIISCPQRPDGLWCTTIPYPVDNVALSLGLKRPKFVPNSLSTYSAEVENVWSYKSTPPYAFMTWYLIKNWDNFQDGRCPSSGILKNAKERNVSETGSVSVLGWEIGGTYSDGYVRKS